MNQTNRRPLYCIAMALWGAATLAAAADVPTVSIGNSTLVQPTAATTAMEFELTRTGDTNYPVSVGFQTFDITATAGSDYTATHGALTIPAGATDATIQVPVLPGISTVAKDFLVNLTGVSGPLDPNGLGVSLPTGSDPLSVTAADFNGDGEPDLAVTNAGGDSVSVLLNIGSGAFAAKVDYATGINPQSVTAADFNGDGKPDLAVTNAVSGTVSVLLNTGSGAFAPRLDYATGSNPQSVTAADFNGDGKPDLGVANVSSNTVSVLLNTGSGAFAAKIDYSTGSIPTSVTTADLNGDSNPDLAVTNAGSDSVSVLLNTGSGAFAAKVDYGTGSTPSSVVAADFNGDGNPDLAVANFGSTSVSVLPGTGGGTFLAKVDYGTGSNPGSVAAADFNGDGAPDLAAANSSGNTVSVLLNTGSGAFADTVDYGTANGLRSVTAADFNGDGMPDLAVSNQNVDSVSVLLNAGSGVFAARADYATGTGPLSVASADFNADFLTDLAVVNSNDNTVSVLINSNGVGFSPRSDYGTGLGPAAIATDDFNADGLPDLAVANCSDNSVSVLLNSGGAFADKVDYPTGNCPASVIAADVDGDGRPDLATANLNGNSVSVLFNSGGSGFAAHVEYETGSLPQSVVAADFDSSGTLDLAVANFGSSTVSVLLNTGSGEFAAKADYGTGPDPIAVTVADFNGDAKPDLAAANNSSDSVSVLLNAGSGTFADKLDHSAGNGPSAVAAADFNGDGQPDVAVTNGVGDTVSILLNTGGGVLAAAVDYGTGSTPLSVHATDFNFDGKAELAIANGNDNTVSVTSLPFLQAQLGTAQGLGTIFPNVDPTVAFAEVSRTVGEDAGTVSFTVELSSASGQTVTVPFTVSGTASDSDYSGLIAGTLSFVPGNSFQTLTFDVTNDPMDEPDETLVFTLGTPTNATPGSTSEFTLTIEDDDNAPTVRFAGATQNIAEAVSTGTATATLLLSAASAFEVTVPFAVGVTSTAGPDDYSVTTTSPVTIAAGETSVNIVVAIVNDDLGEPVETVVLELGEPTNATIASPSTTTVRILLNDTPTLAFEQATSSFDEDAGTVMVSVRLSGPSSLNVSVPFTVGGDAVAADRSITGSSPLVIPAGAIAASIALGLIDDGDDESDETVEFTLGTPSNATLPTTAIRVHTLTIVDNDDPAPPAANLVQNSGFESGSLAPWYFFASGNAQGNAAVVSNVKFEGLRSARVNITRADTAAPWNATLAQRLNLVAGTAYSLKFRARADRNLPIRAVLQSNAAPFTAYLSQDPRLTTAWQEVSFTFTAPVSTGALLSLNLGLTVGTIWVDDFSLTEIGTPPPPPPPTPVSLVQNPGFENATLDPWYFFAVGNAQGTAAPDTAVKFEGARSVRTTLTRADTAAPWNATLAQQFNLVAGTTYTLKFRAMADRNRLTTVMVQLNGSPFTAYLGQFPMLNTSWQQFTYSFTAPVSTGAILSFNMGQSVGNVWIDAVELQPM